MTTLAVPATSSKLMHISPLSVSHSLCFRSHYLSLPQAFTPPVPQILPSNPHSFWFRVPSGLPWSRTGLSGQWLFNFNHSFFSYIFTSRLRVLPAPALRASNARDQIKRWCGQRPTRRVGDDTACVGGTSCNASDAEACGLSTTEIRYSPQFQQRSHTISNASVHHARQFRHNTTTRTQKEAVVFYYELSLIWSAWLGRCTEPVDSSRNGLWQCKNYDTGHLLVNSTQLITASWHS